MQGGLPDHKHDLEARLLVVDDEPRIRTMLVRGFNLIGFKAEEASSGLEAISLLNSAEYDVMILDLFMPDIDGLEVMQKAREIQPDLSIIVLTGNASLQSAITSLRSEAADYLIKPTNLSNVFRAVTQALAKRTKRKEGLVQEVSEALAELQHTPAVLENLAQIPETMLTRPILFVPPLRLDRANRSASLVDDPNNTIELTKGEMAVLITLMTFPNQPLSCQQIVHYAWGYDVDKSESESIIRPYVYRLRQKLEKEPNQPRLIRTIRRKGYLFISGNDDS